MPTVRRALKEWDAICRAIDAGRISILVRKAGILDPEGPVEAGREPFALFPTFEHQRAERLREGIVSFLRADPSGGREASLTLVATAVAERLVTDADLLDPLGDSIPLSRDHVLDRIAYGRRRGVRVILIRAARLATPVRLEVTPEIEGCVSFVPLGEPIDATGAAPVLSDAEFAEIEKRFHVLGA